MPLDLTNLQMDSAPTDQSGLSAPLVNGASDFHASYAEDAAQQDGVSDFITQGGAVSAIVSGAVSMYNTGAELATYLGADDHTVKTEDVLSNFMSADSVDYYKRHQEGLDALGFVATSLVPGLAGIKGLKMMQTSLRASEIGTRTRLATGIRAALIPSERAAAMADTIKAAEGGYSNISKFNLFKEAFHQQALEAAAFEGAVDLTMNQNPTINKDGLDYFDSLANLATSPESYAAIGIGGLIGGGVDSIVKYAGLKKLVTAEELRTNTLYKITDVGEGSFLAGDKATTEFSRWHELNAMANAAPEDTKAASAVAKQRGVVLDTLTKAVSNSNFDRNGATAMANQLFELFTKEGTKPSDVAKVISGVQKFNTISSLDMLGNVQSKSHILFMDDNSFYDVNAKYLYGLRDLYEGKTPSYTTTGALGAAQNKAAGQQLMNSGTRGFAFPYDASAIKARVKAMYGSKVTDEQLKWVDDVIGRSFSSVEHYKKLTPNATTEDIAFTLMHELGHMQTNMPEQGVLGYLAKNGNKNARAILSQMEGLSRSIEQRSGNWNILDKLQAGADTNSLSQEGLDKLASIKSYMKDPYELLADTWSHITNAIVDNDTVALNNLKRNAPDVYKMFRVGVKSQGIQGLTDKLLAGRRRLLNMETGELVDHGISPTIADIGNIKESLTGKVKTITWGREGSPTFGQVSGDTKFDLMNMSPQEANAMYRLRLNDPKPVAYEVPIAGEDFPRMTRALHDLQEGNTDFVNIKIGEDVKKYTNIADYKRDFGILKNDALNQLRGAPVEAKLGGTYTYREIARLLDVGDDVAFKGTASYFDNNVDKFNFFHSVGRDLDKPTHVSLMFGKNALTKDSNGFPFLLQGLSNSQRRIMQQKQLIRTHLGTYAGEDLLNQFPTTVNTAGASNFADRITTADKVASVATSGNEDYFKSDISFIGKLTNTLKGVKQKAVQDTLLPYAQAVIKTPEAKGHMAAMDSLLRQRFYRFLVNDSANLQAGVNDFKQLYATDIANSLAGGDIANASPEIKDAVANVLQNSKLSNFVENMTDHTSVIYAEKEYGEALANAASAIADGDIATAQGWLDSMVSNNHLTAIQHKDVSNFYRIYTMQNDELVRNRRNLNQFTGRSIGGLQEGRIYPGTYNTKDLPFFKFVISAKQDAISNDRHVGIISGRTADELKKIEGEVKAAYGDDVEIVTRTKEDIERWKQLQGQYDAQLAIDENSMNAELHRKGRAWNVAPVPSERTVENYMNSLLSGHATLSREFVAAHYGEEIATLNNAAKDFEELNRATWGAKSTLLGDKTTLWKKLNIGNPFSDKIRQMLDINNLPEYKTWYNMQQTIADKFNNAVQEIKHSFSMLNEDMLPPEQMNRVMEKYGLRPAFDEGVTDYLYKNTKIPRNTLQAAVSKVNGIIGTLMLRMDGAQAITDVLSTAITTAPELKMLVKAVNNGELQDLLHVKVPNMDMKMPSASKVMFKSVRELFTDSGKNYMKDYENMGLLSTTTRDLITSIDDTAKIFDIKLANENPTAYSKAMSSIKDNGMKALTYFNDKGVEFSKFLSLRSADQIIEAAGITDQSMRRTILNTFVNRTHGNYLASQRPALFQGWGGQLIGLFQTYQFNLIQQFARHLGEDKSAALAMIGIQSGIFGAQSLPGFSALNQLVMERNKGSADLYTGTNNLMGKEAGDWLMYGLGSQITTPVTGNGIGLYSRGNLTPRTPILIPTNISDIPAFKFTHDVIGNIATTVGRITQADTTGQATQAFWEGIAHNGANRPLQGLGQLLAGGRTTSKGGMITAYNEVNASLMLSKALGVAPLDEAIAVDAFYRYEKFTADKNSRLMDLGNELKTAIRGGDVNNIPELTDKFMKDYTTAGGKAEDFGKWFKGQFLGATQSQLIKVRGKLGSPEGTYMQGIMGAKVPEDFKLPTGVEENQQIINDVNSISTEQ